MNIQLLVFLTTPPCTSVPKVALTFQYLVFQQIAFNKRKLLETGQLVDVKKFRQPYDVPWLYGISCC